MTKMRRLLLWFLINLIIFVACYLNYRLQLKHRYLYKTLNIGLCLSRAAAMVINFNLLLVWLPMCKYSLTRLACFATNSLRRQKYQLSVLKMVYYSNKQQQKQQLKGNTELVSGKCDSSNDNNINRNTISKFGQLVAKFKILAHGAVWQLRRWFYCAKLNSISSFLVAVDHCTSLHTICATTIFIASVIHTVAHLMNVINFSNNYDPLLSNLNMAEYKGQNPLQLLISVPGITGSLMIIILLLMSLSSVNFIRNSSFDLFQVFHRLSVVFVILLFLHPSSHVLKEQSNVDRHNPELCYDKMAAILSNSTAAAQVSAAQVSELTASNLLVSATNAIAALQANFASANSNGGRQRRSDEQIENSEASSDLIGLLKSIPDNNDNKTASNHNNKTTTIDLKDSPIKVDNHFYNDPQQQPARTSAQATAVSSDLLSLIDKSNDYVNSNYVNTLTTSIKSINMTTNSTVDAGAKMLSNGESKNKQTASGPQTLRRDLLFLVNSNWLCSDLRPLFVAQSSICWYVLSIGLSCYLVDIILRKLRRSKSSIQLLDARLDGEGNLIELILSNNHKRFTHWSPGQFVYLNCPQIATFEWHPFTISSMDNESGQFTLHIKAGGDWTRKLRERLKLMQYQNSMSLLLDQEYQQPTCQVRASNLTDIVVKSNLSHLDILPNFDCYNKLGKLQVECTRLVCIKDEYIHQCKQQPVVPKEESSMNGDCFRIELKENPELQSGVDCTTMQSGRGLELYIDGPFHSPFERLLEQQVSVCIANGVGWTAFSSVFHFLTNDNSREQANSYSKIAPNRRPLEKDNVKHDSDNYLWWTRWQNFSPTAAIATKNIDNNNSNNNYTQTKLPVQLERLTSLNEEHIKKLSESTKLHLMVIVTNIQQLRPFYNLALDYFKKIQQEVKSHLMDADCNQLDSPVKEITAFLTRSCKDDEDVKEFCEQENLSISNRNHILRVNDLFTIQFGKPRFDLYLGAFTAIYPESKKISVYCCGSYQVKKDVREICFSLNRINKIQSKFGDRESRPLYSYQEENF